MPKLQLSLKNDGFTKQFELVEVQYNIFMLKTKNETSKLYKAIKHWMMESSSLDEVAYTKSLKKRIDVDMTIKSSFLNLNENDVMNETYYNISENNTFAYKKMAKDNSQNKPRTENDHLFIGAEDGHLIEYSHSKQKIVKSFDNLMQKSILALTITNDKQD